MVKEIQKENITIQKELLSPQGCFQMRSVRLQKYNLFTGEPKELYVWVGPLVNKMNPSQ